MKPRPREYQERIVVKGLMSCPFNDRWCGEDCCQLWVIDHGCAFKVLAVQSIPSNRREAPHPKMDLPKRPEGTD